MTSQGKIRSAVGGTVLILGMAWLAAAPAATATEASSLAEETAGVEHADSDAGSDSTQEPAPAAAPQPARASALSKLQIHGFLTQAYATGNNLSGGFPRPPGGDPRDALTGEEQALGIPEDGTTDYRFLALQFRYQISPKDVMIVQFSSRALGTSPISELEDEIELDWAFYERRLADHTSVRVGRVQIPFGIFNEIRDVGTLLPFYRPPFNFYREGSFTTETVDGVAFSHTFWPQSDWNLELDLYAGGWDSFDLTTEGGGAAVASRNEDSGGFQLWVNTPISGVSFGGGYQRRNTQGGLEGIFRLPGAKTRFDDYYGSFEAALDRFVVRSEFRSFKNEPTTFPIFPGVTDFEAQFSNIYVQLGFHPSEKFRIYLQWEDSWADIDTVLFTETQEFTLREDVGIALNYLFTPALVLKLEYHEVSAEDASFVPDFTPQGFRLRPIFMDFDDGDYTILSLSAAF